jgi:hypothetical protein
MKLNENQKKELISLACKIGRSNNFHSIELLKKFGTSKTEINKQNLLTFLNDLKISLIINENMQALNIVNRLLQNIN